jgi:transcriptional regulator with XRE-family HTH domain
VDRKTIHRIEEIRHRYNLSNSELENKIGYSNGAFAKALRTDASVKDDIIRKVLEVFPEVNVRWLLLGEGEMEGIDSGDPVSLVNYFVINHERFMKESLLYKEKINNLVKDEFIKRYSGILKDQEDN